MRHASPANRSTPVLIPAGSPEAGKGIRARLPEEPPGVERLATGDLLLEASGLRINASAGSSKARPC